ncbi:Dabb family protein [Rubritalea marina]|uniref:Dabb family protein n=1 Tax=Rubritalea marina TaxID=361055 RepID=UPI000360AF00|nr:Dabb family protein [Rubritalea marina]
MSHPEPRCPYRHIVLFQFKASAGAEQIADIEQAFMALKSKIEVIESMEWGQNVSPEGLNDGLSHAFSLTFASKEGLEQYLPHPAHQAFGEQLRPILEKAVVLDYVAQPVLG